MELPGQTTGPARPGNAGGGLLPEAKLTAQFDHNGDQRLDAAERQAARAFLHQHPLPDFASVPLRPGQMPLQPVAWAPVKAGKKLVPAEVPVFPGAPLYDPKTLRTLFLEFDDADWEEELADFAPTDVLVPARLTMDGNTYTGVGVHVRTRIPEASLPAGYKRSLDLVLDHTRSAQRTAGQRQLRLLAPTTDPTFVRVLLYDRIAGEYLPAPKVNFVRVVINGESWGIYLNTQPLDENFVQENFHSAGGARWTADAGGNLAYLGDDPAAYRNHYRLQSPENPAAWAALAQLCRAIEKAKAGEFEAELAPLLDIDGALRFFALENALINQDGYGSHLGTYGLFMDAAGRFHLIPQDAEASFRLVQASEYDRRPRADRRERGADRGAGDPEKTRTGADQGYNRDNFPHHTETNLAMLLSYSFVNKADSDLDEKVTKEEWHDFARSWFFVMDEDQSGQLTREQFIAKVRLLVTPPSIIDGRTRQTFGKEDPAGQIGHDLFAAMDENHDDRLTREEMVDTFDRWFTQWSNPTTARLTQASIQHGFTALFSRSVFTADQTYIAPQAIARPEEESAGGGGERSGRHGAGGRSGGSGLNLGPLHLGGRGRGADSRTLVTFSEELDPLAGMDDAGKPLLARLLAAPALRARYLNYMRDITENWLTWAKLGPTAKGYRELIADDVRKDTHKAASYENFVQEFDQDTTAGSRDGAAAPSLKAFVNERGTYLQKDAAINGSSN